MDQKSLYELQSDQAKAASGMEYVLKGRDDFILEFINSSVLGEKRRKLDIAELSVGDGSLAMALLESIGSAELTCVDISSTRIRSVIEMVKCSSYSFETRAHFVECNFDTQFDLLADNAFDVVIALDIMEHVFDVFNFMEHCRRILRNQGTLILRVPNIAYIKHRLNLLFGALPITASWFGKPSDLTQWRKCWGWDGGHLHLFTIPILYKLLNGHGFLVEQCCDPGTRFSTMRTIWPTMLYANPLFIAKKESTYS